MPFFGRRPSFSAKSDLAPHKRKEEACKKHLTISFYMPINKAGPSKPKKKVKIIIIKILKMVKSKREKA